MMSKVLIVAKTKHGNRAKPILKSEAQKLVEKGEAIRKKDGIYIMSIKCIILRTSPYSAGLSIHSSPALFGAFSVKSGPGSPFPLSSRSHCAAHSRPAKPVLSAHHFVQHFLAFILLTPVRASSITPSLVVLKASEALKDEPPKRANRPA